MHCTNHIFIVVLQSNVCKQAGQFIFRNNMIKCSKCETILKDISKLHLYLYIGEGDCVS